MAAANPRDSARDYPAMHELLSAVASIAEELSLKGVLKRVVTSACELVDATYAALGVKGEGEYLSHFVTEGIDDDLGELIGPLPTGHGVLGLLLRDPRPIRSPNLREHLASTGFPEHHPPMRTFLGVPIRIRNTVFGNLYMTEKRGGGPFTAEDEELAIALASAAGFAIENAKLYDEAQSRLRWLEAGRKVAVQMMGTLDIGAQGGLDFVADTARDASESALALICGPPNEEGQLLVTAGAGQHSDRMVGQLVDLDRDSMRRVLVTGVPSSVARAGELLGPGLGAQHGPAILARLGTEGAEHGLLALVGGSEDQPYATSTLDMVAVFCAQSALALELARAHRIREQLLLYQDRDRIAQDLHDVVIQGVFAAGLSVQSLSRYISDPVGLARIHAITDELDATTRELRDTIYSLRASAGGTDLFSSRILNTVRRVATPLAFAPRLQLSGPIDADMHPELAAQALAVVSEGLSNAVRHANARLIDVSVASDGSTLTVTVEDDGHGFHSSVDRSGLANMQTRATAVQGSFRVESSGAGTKFFWSAPLVHG